MEKSLNMEERIRRAEQIRSRRKGEYSGAYVTTVKVTEAKDYGLFKKLILQMLICLVIYFIFYLIQTGNYIFSEDMIERTKQVLSYDINIPELWNNCSGYFQEKMQEFLPQEENKEQNKEEKAQQEKIDDPNQIPSGENTSGNESVGGAEIENAVLEEENRENVVLSDDEYVKTNFSLIKPLQGVVSSEFGQRDSSNAIVSKNHTGIDIAANTGTVIVASMEGKVTVSSTVGDYGYHIKIENQDITTLYGHCSKLYVKQGEEVKQGQEIAEVGSTGKSTGPHLHFEIIRNGTYLNPRNILDF